MQIGLRSALHSGHDGEHRRNIVLFGDSLTSQQSAYTRLGDVLGSEWQIINEGAAGDRTDMMLARITDVTDHRGVAGVVVLGGVNDLAGGARTEADIKADLQSIYTAIAQAGMRVVAQTILPWGNNAFWTAGKQVTTLNINSWIRTQATDVSVAIDTYAKFEDPASAGDLIAIFDNGDGLHLNSDGFRKLQSYTAFCGGWKDPA